jgi:hypothetical protein
MGNEIPPCAFECGAGARDEGTHLSAARNRKKLGSSARSILHSGIRLAAAGLENPGDGNFINLQARAAAVFEPSLMKER